MRKNKNFFFRTKEHWVGGQQRKVGKLWMRWEVLVIRRNAVLSWQEVSNVAWLADWPLHPPCVLFQASCSIFYSLVNLPTKASLHPSRRPLSVAQPPKPAWVPRLLACLAYPPHQGASRRPKPLAGSIVFPELLLVKPRERLSKAVWRAQHGGKYLARRQEFRSLVSLRGDSLRCVLRWGVRMVQQAVRYAPFN